MVTLDGYKILLAIPIVVIVMVAIFIGLPFVKLLVVSPDYDLYVDARIDKQNFPFIGEVLIRNTGSQPLTNVKVDFGEGDILDLGTLKARHKLILTPPPDNKMEFVTVSADQDVFEKKAYREEQLTR